MRIAFIGVAATAITLAAISVCGCTGVVGLAHGDPGRMPGDEVRPPTKVGLPDSPAPAVLAAPVLPGAPEESLTAASAVRAANDLVSTVRVIFSDHAQQLAAADPRLTPAAVALAVEDELRTHQLYVPAAQSVHRTLVITVSDLSSTLASNATVLGYTFRNLVLMGEVQAQAEAGSATATFPIHARVLVSNRDAGVNAGSLAGLYARFAALTVADLRGIEPPAEPLPR